MLEYYILCVTPFQQNSTLFWRFDIQKSVLVNPNRNSEKVITSIELGCHCNLHMSVQALRARG